MKQQYKYESQEYCFIHCNEIERLIFNIKLLRTSPSYTALDKVLQHAYLF